MKPRAALVLAVIVLGQLGCASRHPAQSSAGTFSACAPVEVGPNKWITPICEEPRALDVPAYAGEPRALGRGTNRSSLLEDGRGVLLPPAVDLRAFDGPVRDQGQVGVCWAHALSGVMDNGAHRAGLGNVAVSALHAVAKDSWDDIHSGKPGRPLTLESQWPYEPPKACAFNDSPDEVWCERTYGVRPASWRSSPQLVAELQRADGLHALRFDQVEKLRAKPGDPQQVAAVLAGGRAIWADLGFNREAWQYREMKTGVFHDYEATRSYGHAVVIVGYRTVAGQRQFLIKNSWGTDWAQGGYAWMPEPLLAKHLRQAFVLKVQSSRGALPNENGLPSIAALPLPFPLPSPNELPALTKQLPAGLPSIPGLPSVSGLPSIDALPQLLGQSSAPVALPQPCSLLPSLLPCAH